MNHRSMLTLLVLLATAALAGSCAEGGDSAMAPESARESSQAASGGWGDVVSADPAGLHGINTAALEGCPIESPDGKSLYFASNRPGGHGGADIWVARRSDRASPWSDPVNLPEPVNSSGGDFCPTPLPGGELLFVSTRPGGCGQGTSDIYRTGLHPEGGWREPQNLGCTVNSAGDEFSPSYVPAGGGLLFFSSDRDGGPHEIFVTARLPAGGWGPPEEVSILNAAGYNTSRPTVSVDGRVIVFDSDRPGGLGSADVWWATRSSVGAPWSAPMNAGPAVNSASDEHRPTLSRDGLRLVFGSTRPGGEGSSDIYVATVR